MNWFVPVTFIRLKAKPTNSITTTLILQKTGEGPMAIPNSFCYFAISNLLPGWPHIRHVAFLRDLEYGPRRGKKTISTAQGFPETNWVVSKLLHQLLPGLQSIGARIQESNLSPFSFSFCSGINPSTPSSCLGTSYMLFHSPLSYEPTFSGII